MSKDLYRKFAKCLLAAFVSCPAVAAASSLPPAALPLHTSGHSILDSQGQPVRLISVNWYGFDEKEYVVGGLDHAPLEEIVQEIRKMGFNSVRLPWANETLERDPIVPDYAVAANPQFRGKHAMEVMDGVIHDLAAAHIMVILDNHVSRADWCCKDNDGNGLWANAEFPESSWLSDWQTIVKRYQNQFYVIGADLRNELRSGATWGEGDPAHDWRAAAERGGNAVLQVNPRLLIMVEGTHYSTDFHNASRYPVRLTVPGRLVYSPHDYGMSQPPPKSYQDLEQLVDRRWGFLLHSDSAPPLWVGEFGICQDPAKCSQFGNWFPWFVRYLKENHLAWSYWPLNGTQSSGYSRKYNAIESYGLLGPDYKHIAAPKVIEQLRSCGLE